MKSPVKVLALLSLLIALYSLPGWSQDQLYRESGGASWYGPGFHGRITASGERFNTNDLTAAHKTLPFGTRVRVTNTANGKSVTVRINDRGPFVQGRIIDLSRAAAEQLGMLESGTAQVLVEELGSRGVAEASPAGERAKPSGSEKSVQVASFGDRSNAERLATRLDRAGLQAEIRQAGSFYRVIVPGVSEEKLDGVLKSLDELGFSNPLVR
ncbi:septal ring lytic transglycosylase RlpA family protein [Marispirochaeta aestuarii]|uniref:septal ring lytic transglycosylase RlpA family protein n=1 Tax=Marispirochaeta aestuarii TaxID=1963862 RepID=UPI0037482CD5